MKNRLLKGLSGSHLDNLSRAGIPEFGQDCLKTLAKFEMSEGESLSLTFAGFQLFGDKDSGNKHDQNHYLRKLEEILCSASFAEFRSRRQHG